MAEHISTALAELVAQGIPCDPVEVRPPCWYILAIRPGHQILDGWGYEPYQLRGNPGILWVYPEAPWRLEVEVNPAGELGRTRIAVYEGPLEDLDLGEFCSWPGLRKALQIGAELYGSALNKECGQRRGVADHG